MSNFANLLGELQQTAQKAASAAADGAGSDRGWNQKRRGLDGNPTPSPRRGEGERTAKRRRDDGNGSGAGDSDGGSRGGGGRPRPPPDARDLRVTVSFLCIGSQKGGTTWLHEMLRRHPGLSLPERKEVHFWDWHRRRGLGWYSRQFPAANRASAGGASGAPLCGEITPCYSVLPNTDVREIRALFPRVRIIFVARDLVDRAWSALLMELRNSVRGVQEGDFAINDQVDRRQLDRIDRDSDPAKYSDGYFLERLRHSTHTDRSDYATGLRRWLSHFDREQLLIMDYCEISARPREVLTKACRHIGADDRVLLESLTEEDLSARVNAAVGSTLNRPIRPSLRRKMEAYLQPLARDFNRLLDELGYVWRIPEYTKVA